MSDPYARRDRPPSRRRPARRRRSRGVYIRRRILALIVAVLLVVLAVFVVARVVRAVQPASPSGHETVTRARSRPRPASPVTTVSVPATVPPGTAPAGHTTVQLTAVGDLELGTTGHLPPDPAHYLDPVRSSLAAPIVFGNLEGTLSTDASGKCAAAASDCYAFQDPPAYARYLRAEGFNVLNSANNHSDDFGPEGVTETSAALASAGIVQAGLPGQIGLIADGSTKVAFVDFAPYKTTNDLLDLPAATALIKKAETVAPVVIVYMHAGAEGAAADHVTGAEETYLGEDRGNPEAFAHAAIDAGASAVIASGPHVLRGMQFYDGHLIAYSLGDFAGYTNFATDGLLDLSGILHLTLSPTGAFVGASWTSVVLNGVGAPAVDPTGASATLVNQLSTADFASSAALIGADGSIRLPTAPTPPTTTTTTAG